MPQVEEGIVKAEIAEPGGEINMSGEIKRFHERMGKSAAVDGSKLSPELIKQTLQSAPAKQRAATELAFLRGAMAQNPDALSDILETLEADNIFSPRVIRIISRESDNI